MSGGEKFMLGYKIATAGADIAMSGFTPISAISSVQDAISIARTIQAARVSLNVSFAAWEKSVNDQQQLLAGKAFKSIPHRTAPPPRTLTFVDDTNPSADTRALVREPGRDSNRMMKACSRTARHDFSRRGFLPRLGRAYAIVTTSRLGQARAAQPDRLKKLF